MSTSWHGGVSVIIECDDCGQEIYRVSERYFVEVLRDHLGSILCDECYEHRQQKRAGR